MIGWKASLMHLKQIAYLKINIIRNHICNFSIRNRQTLDVWGNLQVRVKFSRVSKKITENCNWLISCLSKSEEAGIDWFPLKNIKRKLPLSFFVLLCNDIIVLSSVVFFSIFVETQFHLCQEDFYLRSGRFVQWCVETNCAVREMTRKSMTVHRIEIIGLILTKRRMKICAIVLHFLRCICRPLGFSITGKCGRNVKQNRFQMNYARRYMIQYIPYGWNYEI